MKPFAGAAAGGAHGLQPDAADRRQALLHDLQVEQVSIASSCLCLSFFILSGIAGLSPNLSVDKPSSTAKACWGLPIPGHRAIRDNSVLAVSSVLAVTIDKCMIG